MSANTTIPPEIIKQGQELRQKLLPAKSQGIYEKTYVNFQEWKNERRIEEVTDDVLLTYLDMWVCYVAKYPTKCF